MAKVAKTLIALRLNAEATKAIKFWAAQDKDSQAGVVERAMAAYDAQRTGVGTGIDSSANAVTQPAPVMVMAAVADLNILQAIRRIDAVTSRETGFPIQCRHCGNRGAGATKFATICFGCKSDGHSNTPADCPVCTAGQAI